MKVAATCVRHAKSVRVIQRQKLELEQQVTALTGGHGFLLHQRMQRERERANDAARDAAAECSICFLEGGEHEPWCQCETSTSTSTSAHHGGVDAAASDPN